MSVAVECLEFKLVCESCGSLTVIFPAGANPDPHELITCGRCGSPRGTLLMLRERSLRADPAHNVFGA